MPRPDAQSAPNASSKPQTPDTPPKIRNRPVAVRRKLSEELIRQHNFATDQENILHYYDPKKGTYLPDGELIARQFIAKKLGTIGYGSDYSRGQANDVFDLVRLQAKKLWLSPGLEKVNLLNGLYNLVEHKLEPHDSDFLSPIQMGFEYDPSAECPVWDAYIKGDGKYPGAFSEDCQHIPAEMLAWLMTPNTSSNRVLLFKGGGSNGKSILLHGMQAALGGIQNMGANTLTSLESNRFAPISLVGKLANFCGDLPQEIAKESYILKSISGQDTITVEGKGREPFKVKIFARLIASANHLPKCVDVSEGWFRRWWIVPMEAKFQEDPLKDRQLRYDMTRQAELSGLFNRALKSFESVCLRGLTVSKSMLEQEDALRLQNEPTSLEDIQKYVDEWYHEDSRYPGVTITKAYEHFKKVSETVMRKGVFAGRMRQLLGATKDITKGTVFPNYRCRDESTW